MKKALSLVLSVLMILVVLAIPTSAAEPDYSKVGFSYDNVEKVDTSAMPNILTFDTANKANQKKAYVIDSADGLMKLSELSNTKTDNVDGRFLSTTFYITKDIDMAGKTWTPLGSAGWGYFNGFIDGQGHQILNLQYSAASGHVGFIALSRSAWIKNLILGAGCEFSYTGTAGSIYVGSFIGCTQPGPGVATADLYVTKLENCYSAAKVIGGRGDFVGGIVGGTAAVATNVQYKDLGEILQILNCTNAGEVSSTTGNNGMGGILGVVRNVKVGEDNYGGASNIRIENCRNTGAITSGAKSHAGGILGLAFGTVMSDGTTPLIHTIKGCVNNGVVSAPTSGIRAGGVVGSIPAASLRLINNVSFTRATAGTTTTPNALGGGIIYGQPNGGPSGQIATICPVDGDNANYNKVGQTDASLAGALIRTQLNGVQKTAAADGKYTIRLVGSIDSLNYDKVGFEVSATYGDNQSKDWNDIKCNTVFKTLLVNNGMATATAKGVRGGDGSYLYALNVKDIPVAAGDVTFTVTPFCYMDGVKVAGPAYTVVCNSTAIVSVTLA